MWQYIVTWVISTVIHTPCPDANEIGEFGLVHDRYTTCYVYHTKIVKENKRKRFMDRDSAFTFYNRGLEKIEHTDFWFIDSNITEIEIDSALYIPNLKIKEHK